MVNQANVEEKVDVEMAEKKEPAGIEIGSETLKKATKAAESHSASLMEKLAEQIGSNAGVRAVFGTPIEKDGRTVVPVAQSIWGTGAGTGESDDDGSGAGGGGGAMTRPVGYIEITGSEAHYVPLSKPWQDAKLVIAWALAVWLVSRAVNRILRG